MSEFFQDGPGLANQYHDDAMLRAFLDWRLPGDVRETIAPGLAALGGRAAGEMPALAAAAEADPPRLVRYDPWGRRVDRVEVSAAWTALHGIAAEEGVVATAFERREGPWSRLHQFCRLYLYNPSSAVYSCPLAMTDGAARVFEQHGARPEFQDILAHLTSRDPAAFWTSGQWMTERTGGSDVSRTSTEARGGPAGYRLYGTKWFTSAVTCEVALALARIDDERGLSLFCLHTRTPAGESNGIRVHRLKDKLGTRAMPTAELTLDGTRALLVGQPGSGVRTIATMLNVTRLYNAVCAVSSMRRALALARDYARRRSAFGRPLREHALHVETLAGLELEYRAAFHLVFHLGVLLGREETGEASDSERSLLRLLTPVAKLYTGKQVVAVVSEVLECFGGAGYIEDTGLPRLLRDAQVLPIWEGTTNVLSLDVQRVLHKGDAFEVCCDDLVRRLDVPQDSPLRPGALRVAAGIERVRTYLRELDPAEPSATEAGARSFAFALARLYIAGLMLEHAEWQRARGNGEDHVVAALRWCSLDLAPLVPVGPERLADSTRLAFGE